MPSKSGFYTVASRMAAEPTLAGHGGDAPRKAGLHRLVWSQHDVHPIVRGAPHGCTLATRIAPCSWRAGEASDLRFADSVSARALFDAAFFDDPLAPTAPADDKRGGVSAGWARPGEAWALCRTRKVRMLWSIVSRAVRRSLFFVGASGSPQDAPPAFPRAPGLRPPRPVQPAGSSSPSTTQRQACAISGGKALHQAIACPRSG